MHQQKAQIISKDPNLKDAENNQKKPNFILYEQFQEDYNNQTLQEITVVLKDCLDKLKKYPLLKNVDHRPLEKDKKDEFNKNVDDLQIKVNSIKEILQEIEQFPPKYENIYQNQIQLQIPESTKKQQDAQNQVIVQQNITPIPISSTFLTDNENQEQKVKNTQDQQIQTETIQCIIDHQQVLTYLLQQNVKRNINIFPQCFCNERIKKTHLLSLENRNLFDQLLSQQVENILENQIKIQNKQVFKCNNSFCTFKCFAEKNVDKDKKFYCTLCDEQSVQLIKTYTLKKNLNFY
ncbi:unnamed protein product (macronuclear) [Paramecium tetraurelia]|uniref:Chromosome undetermined scaffold_1, whole genome shotgun sequence n=1 Tax=Paramecium tetraurelia TaxID=5888 RepID=Q6BG92_PARTE|nr:hypothetical protein [Paramecium tetraurelia strain d4-2]XP_001423369.1 uncharacterized protein GSPATT00000406001 [Paramecium tetraurelia]CAH03328.1 hypothetical protein PTMB.130 [Paramecium tetraurelia]CAK55971.1 unnamed protein product [Paramecium tetraurelia]|eukprot:XP_001423369.1 hypothetical protein (macronuclear) [Paramecium tetraurelia strain d4-2]